MKIRKALQNKTLYELRTYAKAAGIEGVAESDKGELVRTICEECRTSHQVRDRVLKQLNLTFLHRHWRPIAVIGLISSILGIVGFFSFVLPSDDAELVNRIDARTSKTLDEKLGPAPAPKLEVLFKSSRNAVGHGILQKSDLPLNTGALFQIHATLSEPGYAYLFHLSEGEPPTLLYPSGGSGGEPIRELYDPPLTENPDDQVWYTLEPPAMTVMLLLFVAAEPVERAEDLATALAFIQPVNLLDHVMLTGEADHPQQSHDPDRGGPGSTVAPRGVLSGLDQQWRQRFRHVRVLAFSHVEPDSQATDAGRGDGRVKSRVPQLTDPADLNLNAFIAGLNPPTVEETIQSLEPIPTLDQLLNELKQLERRSRRPILPGDVSQKVAGLRAHMEELRKKGFEDEDKTVQNTALDEAIELAGRVLRMRLEHMGLDSSLGSKWTNAKDEPAEWYEVGDARRLVADLRHAARLSLKQRTELVAADANRYQANQLFFRGEFDRAGELAREDLRIRRRLLGDEHPDVANSLQILAVLLNAADNPAVSELLYREALAMRRKSLGDEHPDVATNLDYLASFLKSSGNYSAAEPLYRGAVALRRRLLGDEHPAVVTSLDNLAELLRARGHYVASELLYREALAIRRRLLPDEHVDIATSLSNLAQVLAERGDRLVAEQLHREALAMYRRLLGDQHPYVASSLGNLAFVLRAKGDDALAERLLREALAIRRKHFGDEHVLVADSMSELAVLLTDKGEYEAAEPLHRESLAIARKLQGGEHWRVAKYSSNLAAWMQADCDYTAAESLYRESLRFYRKLFGDRHPGVAASLNNLATLLIYRGDYGAAEPLIRRSLEMTRDVRGEKHPSVATAMNNLAELLKQQGNYAAAQNLYHEAIALQREVLGEEHTAVATSLTNLANLLVISGDYVAAEPLLREALAMRRKLLGDEHPQVAISLGSLAGLLQAKGDYNNAELICREALVMDRRLLGDKHPNVAVHLDHLAFLLKEKGDHASAESLLREAIVMARKLGDDHPHLATSLNNLATLLCENGDFVAAEPLLVEAVAILERVRLRLSPRGGLERVGGARLAPFRRLASIYARLDRPYDAFRYLEQNFARGLLDEIALRQISPLTKSERNRRDSLAGRLEKTEERLAALLGQPESTERHKELSRIQRECETRQAELVEFAATMEDKHGVAAGQVYRLEQIQRGLADDSALVAWLDIEVDRHAVNPGGEHWACIVRNKGKPVWIELRGSGPGGFWTQDDDTLPARVAEFLCIETSVTVPPSVQIPHLTHELRKRDISIQGRNLVVGKHRVSQEAKDQLLALSNLEPWRTVVETLCERSTNIGDDDWLTTLIARLRAQRIEPLVRHLDGVQRLIVLPAGRLARVPIEVAVDGYAISYAPSATMYAWLREKRNQDREESMDQGVGTLLALGDPVFKQPGTDERTQLPAPPETQRANAGAAATRGAMFDQLPATRSEVNGIRGLFGSDGDHEVLLGSNASELKLAELAESGRLREFRYLHLATHGVLDDVRAMRSALILSQDNLPDPYSRALANGEVYDGRLTAEQIVRTWKLDAELVTLSACRTALGKRVGGEGFLGFSQALFAVGARSLVLSLWKVDDLATMLLMQRFYENLLGRYDEARNTPGREFQAGTPLPKVEALREAKLAIRSMTWEQVQRRSGISEEAFTRYRTSRSGFGTTTAPRGELEEGLPFEHPYYWAAFVLLGDPE